VRDLDRIHEVPEYRVTGPQLGTLLVLTGLLVGGAGLAGYQAGLMHGPVDEELLSPSTGASSGGGAVLADMLAERDQQKKTQTDGIEGVPPRLGAPELGNSLTDPDPDLAVADRGVVPTELVEGQPVGFIESSDESSAEQVDPPESSDETATEVAEAVTAAKDPEPPEQVLQAEAQPEVQEPSTSASTSAGVRPLSEAPKGRGFTIQLAAYPSPKEADELVLSLRSAGFDEAFYQVAKVNSRTWYRVRVGIYGSRAEADSAASRLAGVSPYDPYITTHP
jgi:cell division protein FtsN